MLNYFRDQPPSTDLTVLQLSRKLIALLALSTGHRMQPFTKITIDNIQSTSTKIDIFIPDRLKTSNRSNFQPVLTLTFFSEQIICPAHTLQIYINKTYWVTFVFYLSLIFLRFSTYNYKKNFFLVGQFFLRSVILEHAFKLFFSFWYNTSLCGTICPRL